MLSYARYIVSTFDNMEMDLKNAAANPTIRLGATIVFSTCFLPEIIRRMQSCNPPIQAKITTINTLSVEQMILNSELDLGIVEGAVSDPHIIRIHLITDQLSLICSRNHKFYGRTITIQDLQDEPVISREDHSYLRNYLLKLAKKHNVTYREFWRCSGNEAVLSAVRSGLGIALTSSILIADELKSGDFYSIPIEGIDPKREFSLIYHKNKFLYPALKKTVQICQEYVHEVVIREQNTTKFILP